MSGAGRSGVGLAFLVVAILGSTAWGQIRNVVMIVADDQRLDSVGAFGDGVVPTPNLDALAARGVSFGNAYCMGAMTVYRDMQRAVRVGDWKLIRYPRINRTQPFDLAADPDELDDLSGDAAQADRIVEMLGELGRWQERVGDPHPLSVESPEAGVFDFEAAERKRGGG